MTTAKTKAPSKYEALDALILAKIKARPATFSELYSGSVRKECDAIAKAGGNKHLAFFGGGSPWRVLDRRLQALRRAGKIRHNRACGWSEKVEG